MYVSTIAIGSEDDTFASFLVTLLLLGGGLSKKITSIDYAFNLLYICICIMQCMYVYIDWVSQFAQLYQNDSKGMPSFEGLKLPWYLQVPLFFANRLFSANKRENHYSRLCEIKLKSHIYIIYVHFFFFYKTYNKLFWLVVFISLTSISFFEFGTTQFWLMTKQLIKRGKIRFMRARHWSQLRNHVEMLRDLLFDVTAEPSSTQFPNFIWERGDLEPMYEASLDYLEFEEELKALTDKLDQVLTLKKKKKKYIYIYIRMHQKKKKKQ
ncbi:hypothetical protein RFI_00182 [Reticulomyxa filosa]|uniref:Uncharacterized protein n=1 Tax=Reticulomyxa filosa TaxID=46433 RepID=X6PGT9_RETFI|nr:hypothetical protein RFI_00182 [Reticulomyxa filosa]|eukprot:ETO36882.1 hypothetical protein RFI_00182 [Reticulomyxa filosa]